MPAEQTGALQVLCAQDYDVLALTSYRVRKVPFGGNTKSLRLNLNKVLTQLKFSELSNLGEPLELAHHGVIFLLRLQLVEPSWVEFGCVQNFGLAKPLVLHFIEEHQEDTLTDKLQAYHLAVGEIEPVELHRAIFLKEHQLNNLIPGQCEDRNSSITAAGSEAVSPGDVGHRMFRAEGWLWNRVDAVHVMKCTDGQHVSTSDGCD
mmetsp:Transcript_24394/g.37814  ORF Transcript_24394/g.37814 Transcript_24394/m.37814 type:complete len:205 (+) Transcript_24394:1947-2561(+)